MQRSRRAMSVGIIGAGRIVEKVHIPIIKQLYTRSISLVSIYDIDKERSGKVATQFGVDHNAMCADELIERSDVVVIASPNATHYEYIKAALNAGKNVICEKPFVLSVLDATTILALADSCQSNLFICYTNRYRPEVIHLYRIIRQGLLGEIIRVNIGWIRKNGIPGLGSSPTIIKQSGGGVLIDLGSHMIDLLTWLLPGDHLQKISVSCELSYFDADCKDSEATWYDKNSVPQATLELELIEHTISAKLQIEKTSVNLDLSWSYKQASHDRTYIHVDGEKGTARLNTLFGLSKNGVRPESPLEIFLNETDERAIYTFPESTDPLNAYKRQFAQFFTHIIENKSQINMAKEGLLNVQIITELYKSAHENRIVDFTPINI